MKIYAELDENRVCVRKVWMNDGDVAGNPTFVLDAPWIVEGQNVDTSQAMWEAAQAAAAAAKEAETTRLGGIDQAIASNTFGAVQPKTVAELKAMTWAEYSAWYDANVTQPSHAIALLKRITLVVIRRVL